mmetsp:Transcript_66968/g.122096  ORF Transcript_66968/g.122096 Transcript_66968/m.122096 type:complete len:124 (+) Transcript_66968:1480-1851(+)
MHTPTTTWHHETRRLTSSISRSLLSGSGANACAGRLASILSGHGKKERTRQSRLRSTKAKLRKSIAVVLLAEDGMRKGGAVFDSAASSSKEALDCKSSDNSDGVCDKDTSGSSLCVVIRVVSG